MKFRKNIALLLVIIGLLTLLPSASATSVTQLTEDLNSKYMILVNRQYKLNSDYVPSDLVYFRNSGYKLEFTCATALGQLVDACAAATGERPVLYSGYRSYQTQYNKYYGKINQYISQGYSADRARAMTDQYYAPPGGSEHHTGLAADICTPGIVNKYGQLHESFGRTTTGIWLRNNCHKYGFILRYDQGKEDITGYNYEPWHFRYVGKEHAQKIFSAELTYEEYIQQLKVIYSALSSAPKIKIQNNAISFSSTTGAEIRYTVNGKKPDLTSPQYTSPQFEKDKTYKAIACMDGYTSPVATVTITKYGDIFKDITTGAWYYDEVSLAVNKGLFKGVGNHNFAPKQTMTRAMMVQVLANISGVDLKQYNATGLYNDVSESAWYAPAVAWATEQDIVQGLGNHQFSPNASITREQVCVILFNHSKQVAPDLQLTFKDSDSISSWAKKGVLYCVNNNIVNGYPDNTFLPQNSATRAEVAKMTLQYLDLC